MNKIHVSLCIAGLFCSWSLHSLQLHEQWWERYALAEKASDFKMWLGDVDACSRVAARSYIKQQAPKTLLDVGSGLCVEYFGLQKAGIKLDYCGLDFTPKLVKRARDLDIPMVEGSVEHIPLPDSSVDICYVRHVLEHLSYYEKALPELIRVASKEVLIIWFLAPTEDADALDAGDTNGLPVYHNRYDKRRLEEFIKKNPKVSHLMWESIEGSEEIILHIMLKC